jgi:predicted CXXCH cytochrome family protein
MATVANAPAQQRPVVEPARQALDQSLHNLSPTNKNTETCIYCHTPHQAAPVKGLKGLWNHQLSSAKYQFYSSSTYKEGTPVLSPSSPSRLCLSCHDGTVALGSTYNQKTSQATARSLSSAGNMGTDLSKTHPFSFNTWVKDNTLLDMLFSTTPRATANASVKLPNGILECTTCHEPHIQNIDPKRPNMFLVVNNANGKLCQACHDVYKPSPNVLSGWTTDAHAVSASSQGTTATGYSSIAQGACMNCHTPHGSGSARLLRGADEYACYSCHANSSSQSRWAQVWVGYDDPAKYSHPLPMTGHDPNEDLSLVSTPRHVKCWDCHNPHSSKPSSASKAPLQASLYQATGVDKDGNKVTPANHSYEVCFKCHADTPNKPESTPGYTKFGYTPTRQVDAHNVRLDFISTSARHNVVLPRAGRTFPDYRSSTLKLDGTVGRPLTSGYLYCEDCHNNNNAQASGGTGPNGPHISTYEHLLERRYDMNSPAASAVMPVISLSVPSNGGDPLNGPFALCNKCHNIQMLLTTGDTGFRHHASHTVAAGISCAVCHAPHGVQGGDAVHHRGSINLDLAMAGPDPTTGRLEINTATRTCYVSCHFSNAPATVHSGTKY